MIFTSFYEPVVCSVAGSPGIMKKVTKFGDFRMSTNTLQEFSKKVPVPANKAILKRSKLNPALTNDLRRTSTTYEILELELDLLAGTVHTMNNQTTIINQPISEYLVPTTHDHDRDHNNN
jgi:hypothetical protein